MVFFKIIKQKYVRIIILFLIITISIYLIFFSRSNLYLLKVIPNSNSCNALNEIQKLLDEDDKNVETMWDVTHVMGHDQDMLYKRVQKVNEWENQKNK